jgi:hypothetical protein
MNMFATLEMIVPDLGIVSDELTAIVPRNASREKIMRWLANTMPVGFNQH